MKEKLKWFRIGTAVVLSAAMMVSAASCSQSKTTKKATSDKTLVVLSWGGSLQDAQRQTIFKPFEKKYGCKIIEASPPDYTKLKEMVKEGKVDYDAMDVDTDFIP
jgi:putative spermidine/putrescine transport system substrate-binding protein